MLARFKALQIGLILASGLCLAEHALALRLGELTIESGLAEPLDATIELLDVAGLNPSQISISLGTEEEYRIAGAEFSPQAIQIQFTVNVEGDTGSIHLTTPDTVDEPFLDLLLNASWPDGTLQREFVVLLNLPGAAPSASDPLTIPAITNASPPASADADFARANSEPGPASDGQSYAVANGDSMWEIAAKTRPSSDIGIQQMMLAIQRANEDAFINNNINRVLSGRVLRIPTLDEINLVDQGAAVTQLSQQNQELGLQPLAVTRTADPNNTGPQQDELRVLTDDQDSTAAAGNGDLDATLAALENEMMLSEESLDRARLENAELTSRFKMLEEEMDLLQNIIIVEDARIAQLQAELAEQAETTEQALATTEEVTGVLAAQQPVSQPGVAGNVSGWLQNTAIMMTVIFALLLVILGYLFWQRRRMNAAVYAFDSGIPELETVDNSSFTPAANTGGGVTGWFSGKKTENANADFVNGVDTAREAAAMNVRGSTAAAPDTLVDIDLGETSVKSRYLDEEQMIDAANQVGASDELSSHFVQTGTSAAFARTMTTEEDDADLADALITEAKGITGSADEQSSPVHQCAAELAEAEREAEALAELVTPDVAITDTEIPESFEFTLKTTPEALAEETHVGMADDMESFDFQLSEAAAAENELTAPVSPPAEREMSDEELQLSSLLLDEEESDFHAGAPMNECDTKLDLAVAYEAMGDIEGAIEILGEVIADGDSAQAAEANRLKGLWQNS